MAVVDLDPEGAMMDVDNKAVSSDTESEDEVGKDQWKKLSERRRAQNIKFSAWLAQKAEKVTQNNAQEIIEAARKADDEILSMRSLMAKQESAEIITSPREYQVELFEKAKQQNIIAVLDTGSGKTLIAVLLLQYVLDMELERRAAGDQPKIAFFLVDSVTLVFQQFAVLECNLSQKVERFCGDMGCDLWKRDTWEKIFKENMVIVCTVEVLNQCLMHSFITIPQINLLIFDEAHHAKKNHPYAKLIKDHYLGTDAAKRPKIFGMTASPVDAREEVVKATKELEALLHAQIATTADLSLLRQSISRPKENILVYDRPVRPYLTHFGAQMKMRFGSIGVLKKLFGIAKTMTSQLGEWCGDHLWQLVFCNEDGQHKFARKAEQEFHHDKSARRIAELDGELAHIKDANDFVRQQTFAQPSLGKNGLSSKVLRLRQYLDLIYEKKTNARCIVFVKERYTARLLVALFKTIGSPYMHVGILIGARKGMAGDIKLSFREQVLTIAKFRKGHINCLFATSVAEEGLDIPDCNRVIRFDLYDTLIQYIQSRGRARHEKSEYIHMMENENKIHLQALQDVRGGEAVMRSFCEALPADRLLKGNDVDLDATLAKEKKMRKYIEPSTGATLTYNSSLVVLAHFVGCLPERNQTCEPPTFVMMVESRQFKCEVVMPERSPIRFATGKAASRKAVAKRSAAFEMCLQLRAKGYLDASLLPTYQKQLPAMRNAHLALNMNRSSTYTMKVKPALWQKSRENTNVPDKLYLTVFRLQDLDSVGRDCQPLGLLTRTRLPDMPSFTLHPQGNTSTEVLSTSLMVPLEVNNEALTALNSFTLRIYQDVFNKKYEENTVNTSYWVAPIKQDTAISSSMPNPGSLIDIKTLAYVYRHSTEDTLRWSTDMPVSELINRYFVDKWDGGRRFFSTSLLPDMKPQDPVPADAAKGKWMDSILDYSVSLFAKSRAKVTWCPDQPVLLAHKALHRLNLLDAWSEKEKSVKTVAYVCPEPLKISALPVSVVSMSYMLPAIVSRTEAYLIALEACDVLGLTVQPALALEALTKDSDNTEDHRAEQVHVQRGMGKNYERLEFIGDCFLKMATSITLFSKCPENDEFEYHVRRMALICNKNLFKTAVDKKIYEYVRSTGFSRRTWYPQGLKLLEGKGHTKTGQENYQHRLGDKTVADVCEAMIGAALLTYKDTGDMDMAVKAVSALVSSPDHDVQSWSQYYGLYEKPAYQLAPASAAELDMALKIEKVHTYHFRYPRLLRSAFVHPGYSNAYAKNIPSYQRLEFLGDALLDMASINFLFFRHPDKDPQWLTEHKMAMVSNKFLAALAVELGFHRFLLKNSPAIEAQVREFVLEIDELKVEAQGARDYWTSTKSPPKCLSDIVESYIGAVFVDSEFHYEQVERFFERHIQWFFEDMSIYDTFANNHPTTHLHNLLTNTIGCDNYRVMANEIATIDGSTPINVAVVMIHDEIIADATASSGKNAKVKACKVALEVLDGLAPFEYRSRYGCDCVKVAGDEQSKLEENIGTAI